MKGSDEPYDPDMTVVEALELGLIAVIDSGVIGRTCRKPCNERLPWRMQDRGGLHAMRCTRSKGHQGVHALVVRSELTADEEAARERAVQAERRRLEEQQTRQRAEEQARMREMAKSAQKIADALTNIAKVADETEWKVLEREASKTYGPIGSSGRKKDQFRDQLMRGKRR